ncbi:MAG: alpha/beta fold hydrolase [Microbacterium sp.]|uniref:alpha/beta hydrolase n=1 Tax=Microbacterium sp. TaxID=51671 RepID=UPI003A86DFBE
MTAVFVPHDVAVVGGDLRVGVRETDAADAPTVLLVHGVTSSHLAWAHLAALLPGVRLIAPDLRGRGRSRDLVGPAGMTAHAADMVAVLDHFGVDRALVVGHSMGAFVSVVLAHRHPERVARLLLVDGGLPLDVPVGLEPGELVSMILGPTAERLSMRFPDLEHYLDFWRQHPGFADDWSPVLEEYFAYDLVPDDAGALHPATAYQTVVDDTVDLNAATITDALAARQHPIRLITVPRGLQNETPGLFAAERILELLERYPGVVHERHDGFNHYTIVMSGAGARLVGAAIEEELALVAS